MIMPIIHKAPGGILQIRSQPTTPSILSIPILFKLATYLHLLNSQTTALENSLHPAKSLLLLAIRYALGLHLCYIPDRQLPLSESPVPTGHKGILNDFEEIYIEMQIGHTS